MPPKEHYHFRLNCTLAYIQAHLNKTLSLDELAKVSCFSRYHFHRIFTAFIGETVYAYIRRLRIERAALKLSQENRSITEIALQSGYETSSAFAKAFKQVIGMTPRQYKETKFAQPKNINQPLKHLQEKLIMKPEIKILSDQRVLYTCKVGSYEKTAPQAWEELLAFAKSKQIPCDDENLIGMVHDDDRITDKEKLRFTACIVAPPHVKPEGEIGIQTIKGGRYAVFKHTGSHKTINNTYRQIYAEWYPTSGAILRDLPSFSKRLNSFVLPHKTEELITEIYIPIE